MFDKYTLILTEADKIPEGVPVYSVPTLLTTSWPKGVKDKKRPHALFVRQEDLQTGMGWSQEELDALKESSDLSKENTLEFPDPDR